MKKIFALCALSAAISCNAFSQITPVPNDSSYSTGNTTSNFEPVDVHLYVVNNFSQPTTFMWLLKDYTIPQQWDMNLCDNVNCYDLLANPGSVYESAVVAIGDTMQMKFQYVPKCVNGSGNASVMIYVDSDSANTAITLNYKADLTTSCPSAILNISSPQLHVFPNPVKNVFTISGLENARTLSFEVYDLKGAAVKTTLLNASNTQVEISTADLPAGEYILKAFDRSGKTIGSSRLNKTE